MVGNALPPIFIIVWLASENSPSRYDHTRPGPTATGLCVASIIFGFIASALMVLSCCLIKFPAERNSQQQDYIFDPDHTMRNMGNEGLTFGGNNTSRNIQHPDVGYALSNRL
ncbi:Oidioi.mRNA.OKI2018_I69.chr2.g5154.t1.cds [Oikopleura dioica]|uniref:Oidioi.mRNA.OKI2018_I69.chr2.g5154.t1.cds n=1 Tax=Oikopleura dioica TaxID=34765 RepID=A0ABN7T8P6_OIKDI|nr:Oidioi.mRNA.OKI2018_I69.chr2.g5154.t1.cds [Oikopleura dioica]